nr:apelin [Pelodiscus sinensis]|eukprot:XP_006125570.1 apelin [Pelodiscus sinensis]
MGFRSCCVGQTCGTNVLPLPTAPLAEGADGKDLEEGNIRNLVHPRGARSGAGHRHTGWGKTPRPRLSHKGPMPF